MRIKNMIRNSFFGLFFQVVLIVAGFFSQRVLFLQAGRELVGMNSVISNILAILSVSELGISTAVVFHLYQALARKNEFEIASLMNLYRRAYAVFALVITALGLIVLPFVHVFLKHNRFSLSYIRLIYGMWLLRTALSYLLSYKRSLLIADQKEYLAGIVTTTVSVVNYLLMILIVSLTSDYVLALGINTVIEAAGNILLSLYVDHAYPFLKRLKKEPLPQEVIRQIFTDVKNIFVMRLSVKLLTCTDSLIISTAIDVGTVGAYANYSLITQSVTNIVTALSNAVQPGIGALFVEKNQEKNHQALCLLTFVFYYIAVTCSIGLLTLMQPFIRDLWLNEQSLLEYPVVVCCAFNCLIQTIGMPLTIAMNVSGLFEKERNICMTGAALNLMLSFGLVYPFGIAGVLAATGCSYLIQLVLRLWCFFRYYVKQGLGGYLFQMVQYLLLAVIEMKIITELNIIKEVYSTGGFWHFLAAGCCCVCLSVVGNFVLFCRSERMMQIMKRLIKC